MFRILILLLVSISVKAQEIYKIHSGVKYHLANCRMVKNVSEKIIPAEAAKLGLAPCKICAPFFVADAIQKPKTTQGQSGTVQSNDLTKAGNRCRHITGIDNRYCYQHFFSATSRPLPDLAYINFNEPKRKVPVGRRCCEVSNVSALAGPYINFSEPKRNVPFGRRCCEAGKLSTL